MELRDSQSLPCCPDARHSFTIGKHEVSCYRVQLAVGVTASERSSSCRGRVVRHALDRQAVSGGHG